MGGVRLSSEGISAGSLRGNGMRTDVARVVEDEHRCEFHIREVGRPDVTFLAFGETVEWPHAMVPAHDIGRNICVLETVTA